MKHYIQLYWVFFKLGICTFGGGYAMLSLLQREIVEHYHWASEDELLDYYAIGQCTPGIIAINTATFIGYKQYQLIGAVLATLGFVTPSIIIILTISMGIQNFADLKIVQHALAGIRIGVCVLILDALSKLKMKALIDTKSIILCISVFLLAYFFHISTIILVISAGIAGIILYQKRGNN